MEKIAGSDTGCYMATALRDYAALRATDPHEYPFVALVSLPQFSRFPTECEASESVET